MKIALIGHRGVGKSNLLLRVHDYLSGEEFIFVSLDKEIEKWVGKSIPEIFSEEGENAFREYEKRVFSQISEKEIEANIIVDVGAGFEGDIPDSWKTLWVQRAIDSSKSLFLNRPNLDKSIVMNEERFLDRQKRYGKMSNFEIELLEHNNLWCLYEKKFFKALSGKGQSLMPMSSWYMTLFENKEDYKIARTLTGCGIELRDDLLSQDTIKNYMNREISFILSLRDESKKEQTLKCINDSTLWDWPLEWGVSEAPIHSLHERKESLNETLKSLDNIEGLIKLAVPIENFSELKLAYDWQKENFEKRVFLPSSKNGRWSWFRLLTAHAMRFSYLRVGVGSSPDQPTLLEALRFNKNFKNWAALLGSPVKHSLTPSTHDFYFKDKQANIINVDLSKDDWDEALPFLEDLGMKWAAVTSPLKLKSFELVGKNKSSELQSTNTLCFRNDEWVGENTDIDGLKVLAKEIDNESVVVWGGGGTLAPLKEFLPQAIFYSSRTGEPREQPSEEGPENIIWAVGHKSFSQEGVYPPSEWGPKRIIDLNYTQDSPGKSCAYNYGCQYHSGLDMFVEQARKQQKFWTE